MIHGARAQEPGPTGAMTREGGVSTRISSRATATSTQTAHHATQTAVTGSQAHGRAAQQTGARRAGIIQAIPHVQQQAATGTRSGITAATFLTSAGSTIARARARQAVSVSGLLSNGAAGAALHATEKALLRTRATQ